MITCHWHSGKGKLTRWYGQPPKHNANARKSAAVDSIFLRVIFIATDLDNRVCPVVTVAINNSVNTAQLAARILAVSDTNIRKRLEGSLADQANSVLEKARRMEDASFED